MRLYGFCRSFDRCHSRDDRLTEAGSDSGSARAN